MPSPKTGRDQGSSRPLDSLLGIRLLIIWHGAPQTFHTGLELVAGSASWRCGGSPYTAPAMGLHLPRSACLFRACQRPAVVRHIALRFQCQMGQGKGELPSLTSDCHLAVQRRLHSISLVQAWYTTLNSDTSYSGCATPPQSARRMSIRSRQRWRHGSRSYRRTESAA